MPFLLKFLHKVLNNFCNITYKIVDKAELI